MEKMKKLSGQTIISISGVKYRLTEVAGNGAQGVVYKEQAGKFMVKLYYPTGSSSLNKNTLEKLQFVKNAKKPKNFVEIIDLIESPYVGYVMTRVDGHKPLNHWLIPDSSMKFKDWYNNGNGFRERLFIAYVIAKAFSNLSNENLSYCDISGNNILVMIENKTASVRMIDVDNIYIAGRGMSSVLGTPRYIAPEVISKMKTPDIFSDNYSLAVILFELLRIGHPYCSEAILDGTPDDEDNAYAGKYEYVRDNDGAMLEANYVFTDKLKELFRRCFVDGKSNRMLRPSAKDFEFALLDAANKVIRCPKCSAWHYPKKDENKKWVCAWCGYESAPDGMLSFNDKVFIVEDDVNKSVELEKKRKGFTTYILRKDEKNIIDSYYILRAVNSSEAQWGTVSSQHFIIGKADNYYILNPLNKDVWLKRFNLNNFEEVITGRYTVIHNGDEIFFDLPKREVNMQTDNSGNAYKVIRTATFGEGKR
jgi:serine/threonine protein kinase